MICQLQDKACRGRLQWHHAIKQQRLRRKFKHGAISVVLWHQAPRWEPAERFDPVTTSIADVQISLDDILGDTRNRVWLCSHHHELVTNGRLRCELPESVWEFAKEFGLAAQLENDLARAVSPHPPTVVAG